MQVAWAWASRSRAVSIEVSEARPIRDFVRLTGTGGEAATSRARDSASLPTVTAGTTRFASPRRSASPASTVRPVHTSSLARAGPTRCDSRWIPPRSGISPKRTSSMAKRTSSAHTRRSQARASWNPAPTAWPWTSATAGLSMWARTRNGRWAVRMNVRHRAPRVPASWPSKVTSMPAENEGPSPRTSTARMPGSEAAASAASPSSLNIRALMALRLSGRASSMVATPSWIPYRIVSKSAIAGHATIGPRALSSAGERRPYKTEDPGSNPGAPTPFMQVRRRLAQGWPCDGLPRGTGVPQENHELELIDRETPWSQARHKPLAPRRGGARRRSSQRPLTPRRAIRAPPATHGRIMLPGGLMAVPLPRWGSRVRIPSCLCLRRLLRRAGPAEGGHNLLGEKADLLLVLFTGLHTESDTGQVINTRPRQSFELLEHHLRTADQVVVPGQFGVPPRVGKRLPVLNHPALQVAVGGLLVGGGHQARELGRHDQGGRIPLCRLGLLPQQADPILELVERPPPGNPALSVRDGPVQAPPAGARRPGPGGAAVPASDTARASPSGRNAPCT